MNAEDLPRLATGAAPLDQVLGGGLRPGAVMVLEGPPFLSCRAFAGQVLRANLTRPGSCVVVSTATDRGALAETPDTDLVWIEVDPDEGPGATPGQDGATGTAALEDAFRRAMNGSHEPPRLVLIDSVSPLLLTEGTARVFMFLRRALQVARSQHCAVLVLVDSAMHEPPACAAIRHLADVVLQFDEHREGTRMIVHHGQHPVGAAILGYSQTPDGLILTSGTAGGRIR